LKAATGSGFLHVAVADPARLDEAARLLGDRLGGTVRRSTEGAELSVMVGTPEAANQAVAALIGSGIELTDFSMGQPSLDAVFFALTGHPAESGAPTESQP
jgi:ABC-2 type transport system ATP-binding protein